jgi:carbonic anhydrase
LVLAIEPAVKASAGEEGDRLMNAVKANVRLQVDRLLGSSVIAASVREGQLKVVGAYYDLDTGVISLVG